MDDASQPIYLRFIDTTLITGGVGYVLLGLAIVLLANRYRSVALTLSSFFLFLIAVSMFVRVGVAYWAPFDCSFPLPNSCRMSEPFSFFVAILSGSHGITLLAAGIAALVGIVRHPSSRVHQMPDRHD